MTHEKLLKTMWKKEKVLVNRTFSFSHNDTFILSPANSFNLDQANIFLSFDKEFIKREKPKYKQTIDP